MSLLLVGLALCGACRRERPLPPAPAAPVTSIATRPAPSSTIAVSHRASFELAAVTLSIEDVKMTQSLDPLLRTPADEAVVNGEFFDKAQRPLGLAISAGKTLSVLAPNLSGGVLWIKDGVGHLTASEEYREAVVDFAIQCRPRLTVDSKNNIKTDDGKRAARTALCLRRGGRSLEIILAGARDGEMPPTLFELGALLAADGCEQALNLDGGPSTGGAFRADGGVVAFRPRGPVRHAVVVRSQM
jgi:hypothetical protein